MSTMRSEHLHASSTGDASTNRVPKLVAAVLMAAFLCGCAPLLGNGKHPITIYAPAARVQPSPDWPSVRWHLALSRVQGARSTDALRIAVRPTPNELQVYKSAQWAHTPGDMLQDTVLHALEDSGRIAVVTRQGSGIATDYRLLLDVRRFESDYAGADVPRATIEVTAKLLHVKDQQLAGSRTFLSTQAARTTDIPDVIEAFEQALVGMGGDLAGWTLRTGEDYERARR